QERSNVIDVTVVSLSNLAIEDLSLPCIVQNGGSLDNHRFPRLVCIPQQVALVSAKPRPCDTQLSRCCGKLTLSNVGSVLKIYGRVPGHKTNEQRAEGRVDPPPLLS